MKLRWPWSERDPSPETEELREKLKEVRGQDAAIRELQLRARKLATNNHLAADIAKALGMK